MSGNQDEWGGFNDFPPGWEEVSAAEFATSHRGSQVIDREEFRQMYHKKDDGRKDLSRPMTEARLFFNRDNTGWAMSTDYWAGYYELEEREAPSYVRNGNPNAEPVRFFLFGCVHDDRHVKQVGTYAHEYECVKCGRHNVIDSGD